MKCVNDIADIFIIYPIDALSQYQVGSAFFDIVPILN